MHFLPLLPRTSAHFRCPTNCFGRGAWKRTLRLNRHRADLASTRMRRAEAHCRPAHVSVANRVAYGRGTRNRDLIPNFAPTWNPRNDKDFIANHLYLLLAGPRSVTNLLRWFVSVRIAAHEIHNPALSHALRRRWPHRLGVNRNYTESEPQYSAARSATSSIQYCRGITDYIRSAGG